MTLETAMRKSWKAVIVLGLVGFIQYPAIAIPPQSSDPAIPPQPLKVQLEWGSTGKVIKTSGKVTVYTPDGKVAASGKTVAGVYKVSLPVNVFYTVKGTSGDYSCSAGIRVNPPVGAAGGSFTVCELEKNK